MRRKLKILALLFLVVVAFDGLKYLLVGEPAIINWRSFVHPVWVIVTLALFWLVVFSQSARILTLVFFIYLSVFIAAFLNQYFSFAAFLTYNCMLFNLVFAAFYYLLSES